jgi:hypothetical protein
MEILLPPMAWKVDDAAGVERVEAIFLKPGLQEPANILLDQDQRGRAIRQQAREVVVERLIVSNNRRLSSFTTSCTHKCDARTRRV